MNKELASNIGIAVRTAREAFGLTQAEVAERVGIATEVYGRLERGHMLPSIQTFHKLCTVLRCSGDELLGLSATARSTDVMIVDQPEVRKLLSTLRKLEPEQLRLLEQVARAINAGPFKR